jgi:hypothetical protein
MNFGHWPARGQPFLAVGLCKQHRAFDAEAFFAGDPTCLFVPDKPHGEGSSLLLLLLFAEHNGPVDAKKITPVQRAALLQAGELAAHESSRRVLSLRRAASHGR